MGSFFDKISGNKAAKKNTGKAVNQAAFDPFTFSGFGANGRIDSGGLTVDGGVGSRLAGGFEGLAAQLLGGAGGAIPQGMGISAGQALAGAFGAGEGGIGGDFLSAARQALGGVNSFNADQFAADRFQQLQGLARPGEERAANSLATRLFSRGRVGAEDTTAGRAFGELDQAQSQAETMRFLQSQDAANQQLQSRIGAAGGLAGTGSGLQTDNLQRFLASLQGGQSQQGSNLSLFQGLLGGAQGATQGISQAFAPTRDAIQSLLGGAQLTQTSDLAQAKIQAGFDPVRGREATMGAVGGFVGGLFSDLALKSNVEPIGKDKKGRTKYKWEWNETAKKMGIDHMPTEGYIAQELLGSDPQAVRINENGYLMVAAEEL